jgi:hypothetical protein
MRHGGLLSDKVRLEAEIGETEELALGGGW